MKAIKTKILVTSLAALTCASFTVVPNRDEELRRVSGKQAIVSDDCFNDLLKNLKEIKAIIYVPDTKLTKSYSWGLGSVEPGKDSINLENYIRVTPVTSTTDKCLQSNKITFDNLNMIVFVDKSYAENLQKLNLVKLELKLTDIKWKVDRHTIKLGDKLNVLIDDTSAGYTQVEYKEM